MNREQGFTLIEILVSLAIFAIVVVGALGVLGAAGSGGFLEGFPTGFVATRLARDTTAAAVYMQAFQEYAASQTGSLLWVPIVGTYCDGSECSSTLPIVTTPISSSLLTGYPTPPVQVYQMDWRRLDITIERWYPCIDLSATPPAFKRYSMASGADCTIDTLKEYLVRLHSKLTWRAYTMNVTVRSTPCDKPADNQDGCRRMEVERFLP